MSDAVVGRGETPWNSWLVLSDGSCRFHWPGLFECEVSANGDEVRGVRLGGHFDEAFQTHLFGHVLSFALVRSGFEPLHMTVLDLPSGSVAVTGDSGYGKSTLAAAFVAAGHRLVTDDLLNLIEDRHGFTAPPGLPRLKLEPRIVRHFLGSRRTESLAPGATKRLVPLSTGEWCGEPRRLCAIYVLQPPGRRAHTTRLAIEPLRGSAAHLAVSASTFNAAVRDRDRLERQFSFASAVVQGVPIRSLSFGPGLGELPRVREAIVEDAS